MIAALPTARVHGNVDHGGEPALRVRIIRNPRVRDADGRREVHSTRTPKLEVGHRLYPRARALLIDGEPTINELDKVTRPNGAIPVRRRSVRVAPGTAPGEITSDLKCSRRDG